MSDDYNEIERAYLKWKASERITDAPFGVFRAAWRAAKSSVSPREDIYRAMLRAVMLRQGGRLRIEPEEMPESAYTIMYRLTEDGGAEAILQDGGKPS